MKINRQYCWDISQDISYCLNRINVRRYRPKQSNLSFFQQDRALAYIAFSKSSCYSANSQLYFSSARPIAPYNGLTKLNKFNLHMIYRPSSWLMCIQHCSNTANERKSADTPAGYKREYTSTTNDGILTSEQVTASLSSGAVYGPHVMNASNAHLLRTVDIVRYMSFTSYCLSS